MNSFRLGPRKSRKCKPTIKEGDVIKTIHGDITVLSYGNNTNVQIEFADKFIKPNPEWVTVRAIRKMQIKPERAN